MFQILEIVVAYKHRCQQMPTTDQMFGNLQGFGWQLFKEKGNFNFCDHFFCALVEKIVPPHMLHSLWLATCPIRSVLSKNNDTYAVRVKAAQGRNKCIKV